MVAALSTLPFCGCRKEYRLSPMPPAPPTATPGVNTITTFAGTGTAGDGGQGVPADQAQLDAPTGLAFDQGGNLFIADSNAGEIRKVTPGGIITRVAGDGFNGYSGDGGPATAAELNQPYGLAFDAAGNLLIAEMYNRVRMIDTSGIIHTVAGTGSTGSGADEIPAVSSDLSSPSDVDGIASGGFYVVDNMNYRVRRVDTAGIIHAFAGTGYRSWGGNGGPAMSALFCQPTGVLIGPAGDIFVSDFCTSDIRRIDTVGNIWAYVGVIGMGTYTGDGGPALSAGLHGPIGMAFDPAGNFYFADSGNNCIRKVDAGGIITTVAGNGTAGSGGDGGTPDTALLNCPTFLAFGPGGDLYFSDSLNHRVRRIRF